MIRITAIGIFACLFATMSFHANAQSGPLPKTTSEIGKKVVSVIGQPQSKLLDVLGPEAKLHSGNGLDIPFGIKIKGNDREDWWFGMDDNKPQNSKVVGVSLNVSYDGILEAKAVFKAYGLDFSEWTRVPWKMEGTYGLYSKIPTDGELWTNKKNKNYHIGIVPGGKKTQIGKQVVGELAFVRVWRSKE